VVPFAAVTLTQIAVHCASPVVGLVCQHKAPCLSPIGGALNKLWRFFSAPAPRSLGDAYSSAQFPAKGQPPMQRMMIPEVKEALSQKLKFPAGHV
jgi:hypothetical protein